MALNTKVRKVVQVGLTPVRCPQCNALLLQGTKGSVISVVCGRCGTHLIAEIPDISNLTVDKVPVSTQVIGQR